MKSVYRILQKDPVMRAVVRSTGKLGPFPPADAYRALISSIISQQLSTKAADTIKERLYALYPRNNPRPELIIATSGDTLRSVGLSAQKAGYIRNVAQFSIDGGLDKRKLNSLDDEALIIHLTSVKGIGRWTAEILAMFALERHDMFPVDDLGIRQAIGKLYRMNPETKTFSKRAVKLSEQWRPYRSVACRHLWRWKDK